MQFIKPNSKIKNLLQTMTQGPRAERSKFLNCNVFWEQRYIHLDYATNYMH